MKFICLSTHLSRALSSAERFTGKHATLPILGNVFFEADRASLRVIATNLEHAIRLDVPGERTREGKITVPIKIISSFIQSLPDARVTLEEKNHNLFITSGGRETRINGMSADDFPLLPRVASSHSFRVHSGLLQGALGKVLPSVSLSEFKPALTGVFFAVESLSLRLAATDVFRLAEKSISLAEPNTQGSFSFIVPRSAAQELARILEEGDEEVRVSVGDNQVVFEKEGLFVVSRLVEGVFPEYQGIIPKRADTTLGCVREELLDAVRTASIFSSRLQDISMRVSEKTLQISAKNPDVGEYKTEIPITLTGKETEVSFNYRYFLDGLSALTGDQCELAMTPDKSVLRAPSDQSFLYMVAPIRLT